MPDTDDAMIDARAGNAVTYRERAILAGSFVATSLVGAPLVFWFWQAKDPRSAAVRALAQVAAMALLHWGAYRLFSRQRLTTNRTASRSATPQGSASFSSTSLRSAIGVALAQQFPILVLSSLLLDGGQTARLCTVAFLAHWSLIVIVALRRWPELTEVDLNLVRWGFGPMIVFVSFLAPLVWAMNARW